MQINPRISIIIVVFNGEKFISGALKSVINQDYPNIELIIIDGNSTDRTTEIVKKYEPWVNILLIEPDTGIYDAMNKGLLLSSGDWVYFLGSDDELISSTIISSIFNNEYLDLNDVDIVFGNVMNDAGKLVKSSFGLKLLLHNTLHHQSAFYKSSLIKEFKYDTNLRLISDYELNLKSFYLKKTAFDTRITVAICRDGGASTNKANHRLFIKETNFIRKKYVSGFLEPILKIVFELKCGIHYAVRYF